MLCCSLPTATTHQLLFVSGSCPFLALSIADLNSASMKLWGQYPELAVFPGTVLLDDDRPGDPAYPSSSLTQAQLSAEEPTLSSMACQADARHTLRKARTCCAPACKQRQAQVRIAMQKELT